MIRKLTIALAVAGAFVVSPVGLTPASACGHIAMFVDGSYSANEPGMVTIAIRRDANGCGGPSSVDYSTVDDTAKAGSDYSATSGTVTFNNPEPSDAQRTFTVPILDDGDAESAESFKVALRMSTAQSGAITSTGPPTTVTIAANDQAAPPPQPSPPPTRVAPTTTAPAAKPAPTTTASTAAVPLATTTTLPVPVDGTIVDPTSTSTSTSTSEVEDEEFAGASASDDGGSSSGALIVGIIALALASAGVGYWLWRQAQLRRA